MTNRKIYGLLLKGLKGNLSLWKYIVLLYIFIICNPVRSQPTAEWVDLDGNVVATSNSRLVTTIIESKNGFVLQIMGMGEMIFNHLRHKFFIKSDEFVLSDKNFEFEIPYINSYPPGPVPMEYYYNNIDVAPELMSDIFEFELSVTYCDENAIYRPVRPTSPLKGMDLLELTLFNWDLLSRTYFKIPSGESRVILTCYFKKLNPGRALRHDDIGIASKENSALRPSWSIPSCYLLFTQSSGTYNADTYIRPELFIFRSPCSVKMGAVEDVTGTTAVLNGSFKRGELSPSDNMLSGIVNTSGTVNRDVPPLHEGLLRWDSIVSRGFIYSANKVDISYVEYSNLLLIDGVEHQFPTPAEIAQGSFNRGGRTFGIAMEKNNDHNPAADFSINITGLKPSTEYFALPCIKYIFETSQEYFKTGDTVSFKTPCSLLPPEAAGRQAFCNSASVSDLQAAGDGVILWYDNPQATPAGSAPLTANTQLKSGTYYAFQTVDECYSTTPAEVEVEIRIVALSKPSAATPQIFCDSAKLSDLQAEGGNIVWFDHQSITPVSLPLAHDTPLANGRYYAFNSNEGCYNDNAAEVEVRIVGLDAPVAATPQIFCYSAALSELQAEGENIRWFDAHSMPPAGLPLMPGTALKNGLYYAFQYSEGCYSDGAAEVEVDIIRIDAPYAATPQIFCGAATLSDLQAEGENLRWYDVAAGGAILPANEPLENDKKYYAAQSPAGCEGDRVEVTATFPADIIIISEPAEYACNAAGQPETITLSVAAENAIAYRWYENLSVIEGETSPELTVTDPFSGKTYYVELSNQCHKKTVKAVIKEKLNIIVQKRNHTLVVNNNPAQNGGHVFVAYRWYRNGEELHASVEGGGNGGYYYSGEDAPLDFEALYHAEMRDAAGNSHITCPFTPTRLKENTVTLYPNPLANASQILYIDADIDDAALANATIEIYSAAGAYISKVKALRLTPLQMPEKGVYLLKFRAGDGSRTDVGHTDGVTQSHPVSSAHFEENFRVIVK